MWPLIVVLALVTLALLGIAAAFYVLLRRQSQALRDLQQGLEAARRAAEAQEGPDGEEPEEDDAP